MRVLHKVFTFLFWTVTWVSVIAVCTLASFTAIPRFAGMEPYVVLSGSMEPVLPVGALVYVEPVPESEQIESGDVVAYQTMDGTAVIHRVVDYGDTEDSYITKGDANNTVDGNQVAREQILGRYVKHIPMLGFLMSGIDGHVLHIGGFELPAVIPIVVGVMILLFVLKWFTGRAEEDE